MCQVMDESQFSVCITIVSAALTYICEQEPQKGKVPAGVKNEAVLS